MQAKRIRADDSRSKISHLFESSCVVVASLSGSASGECPSPTVLFPEQPVRIHQKNLEPGWSC